MATIKQYIDQHDLNLLTLGKRAGFVGSSAAIKNKVCRHANLKAEPSASDARGYFVASGGAIDLGGNPGVRARVAHKKSRRPSKVKALAGKRAR